MFFDSVPYILGQRERYGPEWGSGALACAPHSAEDSMCRAAFRIAGRHRGIGESLEVHPISPLVFQCFSSGLQLRLR